MAAKNSTLIVAICSNTKTREGESPTYDGSRVFANHLSPRRGQLLYRTRDSIRTLITGPARVAGTNDLLRNLPYNESLSDGPDFHPGTVGQGRYLPAARRYRGRFYQNLGPDGPELLLQTRCHVLILSGLYGVVTPEEPIQCYSCNVSDHRGILQAWTMGDRLTSMLVEYISENGIQQVIEMTAALAYRQLIAWESVRNEVHGRLYHCFGTQLRGASLLPALGVLARRLLSADDNELRSLAHGMVIPVPEYGEQVHFLPVQYPTGSGIAAEAWVDPELQASQVSRLDAIGRMRRNIVRCLNLALGTTDQFLEYGDEVHMAEERCVIDQELARTLRKFGRLRNDVEYRNKVVTDDCWKSVRACYEAFEFWLHSHKYDALLELEDVF